jgi:hypothetical protein
MPFPILYKGAGPGTHWHRNDARNSGFTCASAVIPQGIQWVINHIAHFSHPSAYISVSASYAVAADYAMSGPAGPATSNNPGYVYTIDLNVAAATPSFAPTDPLAEMIQFAQANGAPAHAHHGDQQLIHGMADRLRFQHYLSRQVRHPGGRQGPSHHSLLNVALTCAIRDAELLAGSVIPRNCVLLRDPVY